MQMISKQNLLDAIRTGHQQFNALLGELDEAQMLQPGVIGAWSVKDILAHIVVHEQRMLDWTHKRLRGEPVDAPQPYAMPDEPLNLLNEQIYQQNRDRPLAEVLKDLETSHQQALALVSAAPEAGLFDAGRFCLQGGEPLWEAVAANTYDHYEEHARDIRAWFIQSSL